MQEITFRTAVDATGSAVLCRLCGEKTLPHANGNSAAGWYYGSHAGGLKLHMLGFADIVPGSERDGQVAQGPRFTGDTGEDVNAFLYQSHAMTLVAASASPVWNSICKMGINAANEKMLSTADRILKHTDSIRYRL